MAPIDLLKFAEHSQKVPGNFLCHTRKAPETWKIFAAHLFDFWIITSMAAGITYSISSVYDLFFITKALKRAAAADIELEFFLLSLPFIMFNYFFFSYFLNHGQTCSMAILKSRIKLDSKGFREALKWASRSTLFCLSCGLSYFVGRRQWKEMKEHDYLYGELVTKIDMTTIQLLYRVNRQKSDEAPADADWTRAA
jgi:hypothetical protein